VTVAGRSRLADDDGLGPPVTEVLLPPGRHLVWPGGGVVVSRCRVVVAVIGSRGPTDSAAVEKVRHRRQVPLPSSGAVEKETVPVGSSSGRSGDVAVKVTTGRRRRLG